jgi:endonuclease/exonuclease/phosphatase (EEP) superfamily protein YafD
MADTLEPVRTDNPRRLIRHALWIVWAPFALWAGTRVAGVGNGSPLAQLLAFTPYVAAASLLPFGAALATRRWWLAFAAGVVVVALAVSVLPRASADGNPVPHDGPRLRVLTVNMYVGGADAPAIVDLVRRHHVDLLAVQEFTPDAQRRLDAAGLADLLPNRVSYPHPDVEGSGVFSRFPLRDDGLRVHVWTFTQAQATVSVPGAVPVSLESVHPCAPAGRGADGCWAADLADQPPATVNGPVRMLLGDFNSTLDHPPLRRLIATGYHDAGDARGKGLVGTWPYDGTPLPKVTIDHVLADRRVGVADYNVYGVPKSDHRGVYAELVLPAA